MTNLPAKRPDITPAPEIDDTPTWRELRDRSRDVLQQLVRDGQEIERSLEPHVLPLLRRLKQQLESLIANIEQRLTERESPIEPESKD